MKNKKVKKQKMQNEASTFSDHRENDPNSLIQQQFLEKLKSFRVEPPPPLHDLSLPLRCGFYDGIVALLAASSTSSPGSDGGQISATQQETGVGNTMMCEETILDVLCDLLTIFSGGSLNDKGGDNYEEEDDEERKDRCCEIEKEGGVGTGEKEVESFRWDLLSYHGIAHSISLLVGIFARFPNAFCTKLDECQAAVLIHVLGSFLRITTAAAATNDEGVTKPRLSSQLYNNMPKTDFDCKDTLQSDIVKILCLPFALELDQTVLFGILCALHQSATLESLFKAALVLHNSSVIANPGATAAAEEQTSIIVGLVARLVLTDEMFVSQLKTLLNGNRPWIRELVQKILFESRDTGVRCDVLAVLSHLARQSADGARLVMLVFEQDNGMYIRFYTGCFNYPSVFVIH